MNISVLFFLSRIVNVLFLFGYIINFKISIYFFFEIILFILIFFFFGLLLFIIVVVTTKTLVLALLILLNLYLVASLTVLSLYKYYTNHLNLEAAVY